MLAKFDRNCSVEAPIDRVLERDWNSPVVVIKGLTKIDMYSMTLTFVFSLHDPIIYECFAKACEKVLTDPCCVLRVHVVVCR